MWKNFTSAVFVALAAMASFAPSDAQAQITTQKVWITCSAMCQQRKELDQMMQYDDLSNYMRQLYSNRLQWMEFTDDPTYYDPGLSMDLRCNTGARGSVGAVTASSNPQDQKAAADVLVTRIKTSLGTAGFGRWVAGLPTSAGTYAVSGASFPATTKIVSIAWSDGTQSNFSVTQGGSGWGAGQLINTQPKPPGESSACPY